MDNYRSSLFLFVFFVLLSFHLLGHEAGYDSLRSRLETSSSNIEKCDILNMFLWEHHTDNPEQSLTLAKKALGYAEKSDYLKGRALSIKNISILLSVKQDFHASVAYAIQAEELYRLLNDTLARLVCLNRLAINYTYQGYYNKALATIYKEIELSSHFQQSADYPKSLDLLGWVLGKIGDNPTALKYLFMAEQQAIAKGDVSLLRAIQSDQLGIHLKAKEYRIAKREYSQFAQILKDSANRKDFFYTMNLVLNDLITTGYRIQAGMVIEWMDVTLKDYSLPQFQSLVDRNKGFVYASNGRYTKAKILLEKALTSEKPGALRAVGSINLELGKLNLVMGQYPQAVTHLDKAIACFTTNGYKWYLSEALFNRGKVYLAQQELEMAERMFLKSYSILKEADIQVQMQHTLIELSRIYEKKGDFRKSLAFYKQLIEVKDTLEAQNRYIETYRLEKEIGYKNETNEKELLFRDNRLKKLQIDQNKIEIRILLLSVGLLILLGGLIAVLYWQKNKAVATLREQSVLIKIQSDELALKNEELISNLEEVHLKNDLLQELNEDKNQMLSIISHDLRSPLNRVLGLLSIIRLKENLSDETLDYISKIETNVRMQLSMLTRMLKENEINSGKLTVNAEHVPVYELVNELTDIWRNMALEKQINLYTKPGNVSQDVVVYADRQLLLQALENLISNAIKFSPREKSIEISINHSDTAVEITVKDEGPGISAEDQAKMFKKYTKLSNKPTGGESSTGLGLFIVRKFVEIMDGDIYCKSEVGKGTSFSIRLKRLPVTA